MGAQTPIQGEFCGGIGFGEGEGDVGGGLGAEGIDDFQRDGEFSGAGGDGDVSSGGVVRAEGGAVGEGVVRGQAQGEGRGRVGRGGGEGEHEEGAGVVLINGGSGSGELDGGVAGGDCYGAGICGGVDLPAGGGNGSEGDGDFLGGFGSGVIGDGDGEEVFAIGVEGGDGVGGDDVGGGGAVGIGGGDGYCQAGGGGGAAQAQGEEDGGVILARLVGGEGADGCAGEEAEGAVVIDDGEGVVGGPESNSRGQSGCWRRAELYIEGVIVAIGILQGAHMNGLDGAGGVGGGKIDAGGSGGESAAVIN